MNKDPYCYWSFAPGTRRPAMARCVRSARDAGVYKSFHVFTDEVIPGCDCYDTMGVEVPRGFEPPVYLKAAISKLRFEYFIWIDPATVFVSNPSDVLGALGKSPLHVPFEADLSRVEPDKAINSCPVGTFREFLRSSGVTGPICASGSEFWIIKHEAIECVCDLTTQFCAKATQQGFPVNLPVALGYAMHMLCADPEAHTIKRRPDLWAPDRTGSLAHNMVRGESWPHLCPWTGETTTLNPSIVYQPELRWNPSDPEATLTMEVTNHSQL